MTRAILAYRDGWLCAAETHTRSSEPIAETFFWPLAHVRRQEWEGDLGKELWADKCGHAYSLRIGGFWKTWHLPEGGQTKALVVESAPVPPPKVRKTTKLRWYDGRWQKYSQRSGWVNA